MGTARWTARPVAMPHLRSRTRHSTHLHDGREELRREGKVDHDLLKGIQVKDEDALEALYDRYGALIYTLALRIVGEREIAQEVLQDTFMRCWEGAEHYDPSRGALPGWLMGIARNRAIDTLRSHQHQARLREREPLPESDSPDEPGIADSSEEVALRQSVRAALGELPPGQRQAIELAYYGGLTQAEIAHQVGKPLGTVKTHMRAGMEKLRGLLRSVIGQDEDGGRYD